MGRLLLRLALVVSLLGVTAAAAQTEDSSGSVAQAPAPPTAPLASDTVERATVRLVILDVVVVDKQGRTVPELTVDDFEILARGKPVDVDTLDVACSNGATDEPDAVRWATKREPPRSTDSGRKIVLALDYLHLPFAHRVDALEQARAMIENGLAPEDRIMVAALTGGLRVEQPFTTSHDEVRKTLRRMEFDISLWKESFSHQTERGFLRGMTALFDVLGTVPGPKAVVMFSAMTDTPLDLEFTELAAIASNSRCSLYPVDTRGLTAPTKDIAGTPGGG